jgi:hypothetical protein
MLGDREEDGKVISKTERTMEAYFEVNYDEYLSGYKGGCGQNSSGSRRSSFVLVYVAVNRR